MPESIPDVPQGPDDVMLAEVAPAPSDEDEVLYCTVHPDRETSLRCNKCGRPMCTKCAVRTPVGYRCQQCVRGQQDIFFQASQRDYIIAAAVSFALSLVASFIVPYLGLFFTIILGPVVGSIIAQAVHRATGRRRGRYTGYVVLAGLIIGILPGSWYLIEALFYGMPLGALLPALVEPVLFVIVAASVAMGWFRYGG